MTGTPPLLEARGLSKSFGANLVLSEVSFALRPGEILALAGENGAGKSTLMNVLSGAFPPDRGAIFLGGDPVRFASPSEARRRGVVIAHQEASILPDLTVAENILLGREPRGMLGFVNQRRLHRDAAALLEQIGLHLAVDRLGRDLSAPETQIAEIAKAAATAPKLLILDEPTASLAAGETAHLLTLMRRLAAAGTAVIFISHRLEEIVAVADRAIVLKDGVLVLDAPRGSFDRDRLVAAMVGRQLSDIFQPRPANFDGADTRLSVAGASAPGLRPVSFTLAAGEILGFAGLEGQGQRPLAHALFGIRPFQRGEILIDGRSVRLASVGNAMRAGIAAIPDDRKREGLALDLPVRANLSLFALTERSEWGLLPFDRERSFVDEARSRFAIRMRNEEQPVRELSGGNQQKVVFARWLTRRPKILVLYEPTRGIDVQAKAEIYRLLARLSAEGASVILISSDMLELIGLSDRIAVMHGGGIAGVLRRQDFSEERIMRLASGGAVDNAA